AGGPCLAGPQGCPASPRTVATRRRLASTRRTSSPTRSPRLRVAYGASEVPPALPVKAATTPASSRSSATSTGGQAGEGSAALGGPGRQTRPGAPSGSPPLPRMPVTPATRPGRPVAPPGSSSGCGSALEEGGDVQLVVIAVVAGAALGLAALWLPPVSFRAPRLSRGG